VVGLPGPVQDDVLSPRHGLVGRRRGRGIAGLRVHPSRAEAELLHRKVVGRARRLGERAAPLLPASKADARRHHQRRLDRTGPRARSRGEETWRGRRLRAHAGGDLLRETGRDRPRSVLRRARAGPHRLHPLRRLHARVQVQREEHPGQELPVAGPRRRGRDPGRHRGHGGAPAPRGGYVVEAKHGRVLGFRESRPTARIASSSPAVCSARSTSCSR
jgi:hypothetical protein